MSVLLLHYYILLWSAQIGQLTSVTDHLQICSKIIRCAIASLEEDKHSIVKNSKLHYEIPLADGYVECISR